MSTMTATAVVPPPALSRCPHPNTNNQRNNNSVGTLLAVGWSPPACDSTPRVLIPWNRSLS